MPARVVGEEMRSYYDRRAPDYDDWWQGTGLFAKRERPGWGAEVSELVAMVSAAPARTWAIAPSRAVFERAPVRMTGSNSSS